MTGSINCNLDMKCNGSDSWKANASFNNVSGIWEVVGCRMPEPSIAG